MCNLWRWAIRVPLETVKPPVFGKENWFVFAFKRSFLGRFLYLIYNAILTLQLIITNKPERSRVMKSRLLLAIAAIGMIFGIAGCTNTQDIGEWSITVEIIGQDTLQFTNDDALEIGPVDIQAAMKDGDNVLGEDTWRGILLYDLLDHYGMDSFSVISVEGEDGSSAELDPARIEAEVPVLPGVLMAISWIQNQAQ